MSIVLHIYAGSMSSCSRFRVYKGGKGNDRFIYITNAMQRSLVVPVTCHKVHATATTGLW